LAVQAYAGARTLVSLLPAKAGYPRATSKDQKRKSLGNHRKNALLLYLPRILACEASYDPCAEQPKHKSD
jgi:hypothetical protein